MGTANELWEFADPNSEVSKKLEVSVKAVLNYGARITYIGSIDDQVVPLEVRSCFTGVTVIFELAVKTNILSNSVCHLRARSPSLHLPRRFHRRKDTRP